VIERDWPGFGRQKQFAVDAALHDWVLCLDADERVSAPLAASIRDAFARGVPASARSHSRGATAFSAAGLRMARAIPTGPCACSTGGVRAGPMTPCTSA
jgi:hypothetical protein